MDKVTINQASYSVIDIGDNYPFGGVRETPENNQACLVRKKLFYEDEEDLTLLNQMFVIVQNMENEHIVRLIHAEAESQNTCSFYYEYVPLTIDKWVFEMGQELIKQLQFQILNLSSYLTQNGVKFNFNPKCVGLSSEIKIKYFLNEFTIGHQNKLGLYRENQEKINQFFQDLQKWQKQIEQKPSEMSRQIFRSSGIDAISFSIRESWDVKSWKSANSGKKLPSDKTSKMNLLKRLEQTKKKSQEMIERLKGMKVIKGKQ